MLARKDEEVECVQQQLVGSREDAAGQVAHLSNINSQLSLLVENRDELIQSLRRSTSQHLLQINSLHTSFADFRSSHRQILYRLLSTRTTIRSYLLLRVGLRSLHANSAARARLRSIASSLLRARTIPLLRDLRRAALSMRFRAAAQRAALVYVQRVLGGFWTERIVRPAFKLLLWGSADNWRRQRGYQLFARLLARLLRRQDKRKTLSIWRCLCTQNRAVEDRCRPLISAVSIVVILRPTFTLWHRRAVTNPATLSTAVSNVCRAWLRSGFVVLSKNVSQHQLVSLHSSHLFHLQQIRAANCRKEQRILSVLARTVYVQRQQWALGRLRAAVRATREAEEEWSRRSSRKSRRACVKFETGRWRAVGRNSTHALEEVWGRWQLARQRGKALDKLCRIRRRREEEVGWRRWREFVACRGTVVRTVGLTLWFALSRVIRRVRSTVVVEWATWHRYVTPCRSAWLVAFAVRCCSSSVRRAFAGWRGFVASRRRCRRLASLLWRKFAWPAFYRLRNNVDIMRYSESNATALKRSSHHLREQTAHKLGRLLEGTLHSRTVLTFHFVAFRCWHALCSSRRRHRSAGAASVGRLLSGSLTRQGASLLCRWHYRSIQMRGEEDREAATEMVVTAHTKCAQLRVLCGGILLGGRVKDIICRDGLRRSLSEWRQLVRRMGEEEMCQRQSVALDEMKSRHMRSLTAHRQHVQQLQEQATTLQERTKGLTDLENRLKESEHMREKALADLAGSQQELKRWQAKTQTQSECIDLAQAEIVEVRRWVGQMQSQQKEKEGQLLEDINACKKQVAEKEAAVKELVRGREEDARAMEKRRVEDEIARRRDRQAMDRTEEEKQAMAVEIEGLQSALRVSQTKVSIQADQVKWLRTETKELQLLAEHRREPRQPPSHSSSAAQRSLSIMGREHHEGADSTADIKQGTENQKGEVTLHRRIPPQPASLLTSPSTASHTPTTPVRPPPTSAAASRSARPAPPATARGELARENRGETKEAVIGESCYWMEGSLLRLPDESDDDASSAGGESGRWTKGRMRSTGDSSREKKGFSKGGLDDMVRAAAEAGLLAKDKAADGKIPGEKSQMIEHLLK
eukprot:GHVS01028909.1.p1 GENE.GHVS01028909.1~~GHVS01028909.1.p1  ORF type:complete len:1131 (+),score=166.07 GHVS01028909.1:120-3395(+)